MIAESSCNAVTSSDDVSATIDVRQDTLDVAEEVNSEEVITEEDFKQKMCAIECSGPAAAKLNTVKFNDKVVDVDSVHRVTDKIQMMPPEGAKIPNAAPTFVNNEWGNPLKG